MFKDTTNLRQGELLPIFCVLRLVGTVPHIGWSTYFSIWLAAPAYFANTENQWAEALFNDIPWHFLPATTDRVLTFLRTWCRWLPLHSVRVAFQNTIVGIPHLPYNSSETETFTAVIARTDPNSGSRAARPEIWMSSIAWWMNGFEAR